MKNLKFIFLAKVLLKREIDFGDPEAVIYQCVERAYRDMMIGARYCFSGEKETCCRKFIEILNKNHYEFSREMIEETAALFGNEEVIRKDNKYVTRYGLSQKLVNMTYKYLFVFYDYIDKEIDFSDCDCPLDSIILEKTLNSDAKWTKITKEKYVFYQEKISDLLRQTELDDEIKDIGNLAFDFLNW